MVLIIALAALSCTACTAIRPDQVYCHRAQQQGLCVDVGEMRYLDLGPRDGPVVMLVHGIPTSSWIYRDVTADLAQRGCRVIVPDLIGFGASDKPCIADAYRLEMQAMRLFYLMDSLGIESWTKVCHDLGGFWTWEMIGEQPWRIEKLVVLNTTAYECGFHRENARGIAMVGGPLGPKLLKILRKPCTGPEAMEYSLKKFVGDECIMTDPVVTGYWLPFYEGTGFPLRVFSQSLDGHVTQFPRYAESLRRSGIPAMLIWGALDPVMNYEELIPQFAADLKVPPERITVLADASHLVMEDYPFVVSEKVARFVLSDSR